MRRDSLEGLSASSCEILLSRHARRNERNGTAQWQKTYSKTGQFAIGILLPHFIFCEYNCRADRDSSGRIYVCEENGVPAVPEIFVNADISSQTLNCSRNSSHNYAVPVINNCRFERIEIVT